MHVCKATEESADCDQILLHAPHLTDLKLVGLKGFRFSHVPSISHQSLLRLALGLNRFSEQDTQLFIDRLPVACPALQDIKLRLTAKPTTSIRIRNAFVRLNDLKHIHIHGHMNGAAASAIVDDLYDISQYFVSVEQRQLESIRLTGFEGFVISNAPSLNRLVKILELIELNIRISVPQDEFDAAFGDFCCKDMELLSLSLRQLGAVSELLPLLGAVAGDSLQTLSIKCNGRVFSNEDCWRNFIENCNALIELRLDNAQASVDVFAEIGRSRSLQKIVCATKDLPAHKWLSPAHLQKLAEIRITEGLHQQRLTVACNDTPLRENVGDELLSAGIKLKIGQRAYARSMF